ncbi:adenosylhomocysteinase [Pseudomonas sp. K5]
MAQIDLWANKDRYEKNVYLLPKKLVEDLARRCNPPVSW